MAGYREQSAQNAAVEKLYVSSPAEEKKQPGICFLAR